MIQSNQWFYLVVLLVSGFLVYLLAPILMPFLVSALFAYMGDPLVDRLEAMKCSRTLAVIIVFAGIMTMLIAIPLVMLPMAQQQLGVLVSKLPSYLDRGQELVVLVLQKFGLDSQATDIGAIKQAISKHWREMGNVIGPVIATIKQSGLALLAWVANLVLIPVVTFYLLRDWDILVERIRRLLPLRHEATICRLAGEADEVLGQFLRGQLTVMLALATVYSLGLWIVGLDLSLLIGVTAGLVSFVPYLGVIVGVLLAIVAAVMQFGDIWHLVYVGIVFGVGQALEGMVLTPLLVGDKIGLHPVAVIFAVMAGGQLFGFVGILLALPVAAVIMVLLRHVHDLYKSSDIYHDTTTDSESK